MIPYDLDPSLHPAEPAAPQLDDGYSPPVAGGSGLDLSRPPVTPEPFDPSHWAKSDF